MIWQRWEGCCEGLSIDFPTVANFKNPNLLCRIVNAVEDAILSNADSPTFLELAFQPLDPRRPGIARECKDGLVDLLNDGFQKGFELSRGS